MSLCVCLRAHRSPSYTSALCGVICGGSRTVTFGCRNTDLLPFQTALKMNLVCPDHSNIFIIIGLLIVLSSLPWLTSQVADFQSAGLCDSLYYLWVLKRKWLLRNIYVRIHMNISCHVKTRTLCWNWFVFTNVSVVECRLAYIVKGKQTEFACV